MAGAEPSAPIGMSDDDSALLGVFASMLAGSRLGMMLLSPEGLVRWHNAAAAATLGEQSGARLHGRTLASFIADDAQPALAPLLESLKTGGPPPLALELQGTPRRRWLRVELQPLDEQQRRRCGLGGAVVIGDVTTHRLARQAADREGSLLREAAKLAHIGAWSFEPGASRVRWSDEVFAIHDLPLGTAPEPQQALSYFDDASGHCLREAIATALERGTSFDLSLGLISATGQAKRVRTIASAERDEDGRVVRVAGLFHDITEREQHAQVMRDKEEAERASRAKSEFLSRVSHELRTPLNGVLGFAQLLQHRAGELPGWTAEPLRLIRQAGDHLLTLIDDMLELGAIEHGAPPPQRVPVSLDIVAGEALRLIAPQALAAGIALRPWGPSQAWVQADANRLRQVLLNLLGNAIKYNRPGGEVRLLLDSSATHWTLRVVDNGPGISAECRRQLFQPLNRPGMLAGVVPGSGLGLSIARHLTQTMGGQLELAPSGGRGTEVQVRLQRAEAPGNTAAPQPDTLAAAPVAAAGSCRVLYVEDHPVNAMLVSEALAVQLPRHQLRVAETGEEGLAMVAAERPDIVLLDLNLPGADGYEVLARLRAEPAWADMPCVAVSADAMPEELARAKAAGFDDYWTKPLTMVGLASRIAAIVDGSAPRGADKPLRWT
jgi:signal transduction histidine kinase/ActR/RegA family two-component response regulator